MTLTSLHSTDIGSPALNGSLGLEEDVIEITGGGADVWETSDQFHFAYRPIDGDFQATVHVEQFSKADLYSKAGLMARASLQAGSPHTYLVIFPDNALRNHNNGGVEFQYRIVNDGESKAIYPVEEAAQPPVFPADFPGVWLRLVRVGDRFDSYFSQNGADWKLYCTHRQDLPAALLVGLAVTSHNTEQTVKARFSSFEIS